MKDPGHISLAAWNQEAPYRDADWCDLEQDQRWEFVDPSGFYPREILPPTASHQRGAVPAPTDCQGNSPSDAAGYPAGVVPSSS